MSALKDKIGRLNHISDRLGELGRKAVADSATVTAEEWTEVDTLSAEFDALGPEVERLAKLDKVSAESKRLGESAGRISGIAPSERHQENGDRVIDRRSLGEKFAASDIVKEWLTTGGKNSDKYNIPYPDREELLTFTEGMTARELYDLIRIGGQPSYMVPDMVVPGIFRPDDAARSVRSVLTNGRTTSDTIYFLRELLWTNNAAEVAEASSFDPTAFGSSGRKPQSALTFEQASVPVVTIAHWIPITRQAIADAAQLQTYVEGRLMVGLEQRLNGQLLTGDGLSGNMTGLLETTGVQTADTADEFTTDPTRNTGTDLENFDRIYRGKRLVRDVGRARASFIVLNPVDLEMFMTTTDANLAYIGGGPFSANSNPTMWGLPLVEEEEMTEGHALVGDGTMAAIFDREDANILIDTINDQFIRNMLTILAELRAALAVFRPQAFVDVELASWA